MDNQTSNSQLHSISMDQLLSGMPESGHTNSTFERFRTQITPDSIGISNYHSKFADTHLLYVQATGHHHCLANYYCERKGLASYLLLYTLSGEGQLLYHEKYYSLTANSCVLVNCMDYHKYYTNSKWDFVYIHFNGIKAFPLYQLYAEYGYQPSYFDSSYGFDLAVYRMFALITKASYHKELIIDKILTGLLADLIISQKEEIINPPKYIGKVEEYINNNLSQKISLDDISQYVNLNKYYISHEFKKYLNVTIQEYIINMRISKAKFLLLNTTYSIDQIADQCGITAASHFIKLFKEREKMTPTEFRKEWDYSNNMPVNSI